ncbi:MAG: SUMF1/EgtB/PvdO family nonheme iron enzyme [Polyangiaceae bacterium]
MLAGRGRGEPRAARLGSRLRLRPAAPLARVSLLFITCLANACSSDESSQGGALIVDAGHDAVADATAEVGVAEGGFPESGADAAVSDGEVGPCPADMEPVGSACMDRYEAPNTPGGLPLVMFSFDEAEAWCVARDKRLCFDDEWALACGGNGMQKYPYGDVQEPGTCTDDKLWKLYDQTKLNGWPFTVSTPSIASLEQLLAEAKAKSPTAAIAADHVQALYQAEPSGSKPGCVREYGVFDLTGNVEEWTRRRDGGTPSFHGNLKGRYWAETRTCQNNIITHGDGFRFYEIGFRCCSDLAPSP